MPKLKNVTMAEITEAENYADNTISILADLHDRISKGYCDEIKEPARIARCMSALTRIAAEVTTDLLVKLAMQEQKRELEELLRKKD